MVDHPQRLVAIRLIVERTSHGTLSTAKALLAAGKVRTKHAARVGANELGFELADMLALTPADFYKSMTLTSITRSGKTCTAQARRRATCI